MTEQLCLNDAYLKECEATVVSAEGNSLILDRTVFYPQGGGQPSDTGVILKDGEAYAVSFARKISGNISHEADREGLKEGDRVSVKIDWERRHKLMRGHTSAHILSEILFRDCKALITGNQLDPERCRIDFSADSFSQEKVRGYIDEANAIIKKGLPVTISFLPREEAMKLPQVSKLAKGLPPSLTELRIVDIGGFDIQADGGTHVSNTSEIGRLELLKVDNKGKNNRRMYFTIHDDA